jgi:glucokinase
MEKSFPILGYDIGGTKIAIALGTSNGGIIESARIPNKDRTPEDVLPELVKTGRKLMKKAGMKPADIKAIGIDAPAPMDIPNGLILNPPNNKSWDNVPIRDYLSEKIGVKAYLENDANAGALAEWMFGAGKGAKNMLYLTMSTGIGGGIIANGHLVHGRNFLAGELGHTIIDIDGPSCNCGLKGCYEAFCGGRAVAQRIHKELKQQKNHPLVKLAGGKVKDIDFVTLEKGVRAKNGYALAIWDEICLRHAQAIGMFINIFNPEKIVLGTIPWACGDLIMDPIKQHLPRFCWKQMLKDCELTITQHGRDIGNYAGICSALNCLYEEGEFELPA